MQTKRIKKTLLLLVCMVLLAAAALFTTGCNNKTTDAGANAPLYTADTTLGTGSTVFTLTVTDAEGKDVVFEIHTDKTVVGEALEELGLLAGEEGPYGLYVKTVNGITVDFDKDGKYWAFYIDGEYAMAGIDVTDIDPAAAYALKVE